MRPNYMKIILIIEKIRPCCNRQNCFPVKQITPFESPPRALLESAGLGSSRAKMRSWRQKKQAKLHEDYSNNWGNLTMCNRQICFSVKTNHTIRKPTSSSAQICGIGVATG